MSFNIQKPSAIEHRAGSKRDQCNNQTQLKTADSVIFVSQAEEFSTQRRRRQVPAALRFQLFCKPSPYGGMNISSHWYVHALFIVFGLVVMAICAAAGQTSSGGDSVIGRNHQHQAQPGRDQSESTRLARFHWRMQRLSSKTTADELSSITTGR